VAWLPAAFQQANGWTRLHVGMMAGALILGAPLTIRCINAFGSSGATALWVVHGVLEITLGLWLMHRKLLKGSLMDWYRTVLLPPILIGVPIIALSRFLLPNYLNRFLTFGWILSTGGIVLTACLGFHFRYGAKFEEKAKFQASGVSS